jgi:hypothetical protein
MVMRGHKTMMKNNVLKPMIPVILSSLLIIVILLVAGCESSKGQRVSPTITEYTENGISFEYPSDWEEGSSSSPSAVAALVSPTGAYFVVTKDAASSDFELKTSHDNLVDSMEPTQAISGRNLTVAGLSAYETVFKTEDSQYWVVSLEKDGMWYNLYCSAPPDLFEQVRTDFNKIIDSFKVP